MKHNALVFGSILAVATSVFAARFGSNPAWVGVWNGELDGQPAVKLTLADDTGELGGTVVLNMIKKENGQARVAGSSTHLLMHAKVDGPTLTFQVIRSSDSKELQMSVTLEQNGKARLQCLNCEGDAVVAELVKAQ
jgi:hypothetical protein